MPDKRSSKAACRRLAEAGCSANEIAAISGHATLREIERYTKAADQARMARNAMARSTTANAECQYWRRLTIPPAKPFVIITTKNQVATPGGLEPPTFSLEGCCSIQLSYGALKAHGAAEIVSGAIRRGYQWVQGLRRL